MDSQAASTMSDFSESDRKELQHFMENEQQKAKFQTSTYPFAEKRKEKRETTAKLAL